MGVVPEQRQTGSYLPKKIFVASRDWKACRSLGAIGAAALALTLSTTNLQSVVANGDTRTISMFHTHSKESITVTFKANGRYDEAGLAKLNHFLRDWRNHKETKMNPHLFDILWEVKRDTGGKAPIQIISAYRSPETNGMLRSRSRGVAKFSQHMNGNAIDFRISDVEIADLRAAGLRLQRGGVGFYPGSEFVHMDTGSIRHWPRMTRDQLVRVFPDGKTVHVPTDGHPLKNYQLAAAEIQRRGQFGEQPRTQVASVAPDGNALKRFITGIFGAQNAAANNEDDDEATPPAKTAPTKNVQVASANPNDLPAQTKMRWNNGPNAKTEDRIQETTGALAYAPANQIPFPPIDPRNAQHAELAAVAFAPGADHVPPGLIAMRSAYVAAAFAHPKMQTGSGFAAPVAAAIENRFEGGNAQLATDQFGTARPAVSVVGFAPAPSRAAAR